MESFYRSYDEIAVLIKGLKNKIAFEYLDILQKNIKDTAVHSLDVSKLTKTGKFKLNPISGVNILRKRKYSSMGSLTFSRVLFNVKSDKAIIVVTMRDNFKSGITRLYLLKKEEDTWIKDGTVILEVW